MISRLKFDFQRKRDGTIIVKNKIYRQVLLVTLLLSVVLVSFSGCSLEKLQNTLRELGELFPLEETMRPTIAPTAPSATEPAAPTEPEVPTEPEAPTEPESPVFQIADSADTLRKYNKPFVVGTKGSIRLGTLFAQLEGAALHTDKEIFVEWQEAGQSGKTLATWKIGTELLDRWSDQRIALSDMAAGHYVVSIRNGEVKTTLPVTVVENVYNVQSIEEWLAVPNAESIALLQDVVVPAYSTQILESGAGHYAKNIGNKTVYGNMHTIRIPEYLVFEVKKNNYFLNLRSGTLKDLLLEGPVYTNIDFYTSNKNGMYVHAVVASDDSTFDGCYLSGFRAPVRINDGTITMTDSVFKGGIFANVYVYKATELRLTDVTTIQYAEGSFIGAGIYLEATAGNVKVTAENLTQYNRYTKDELNNYLRNVSGMGNDNESSYDDLLNPISSSNIKNFDALKYEDDTYHLGILVSNEGTKSGGSWLRPTYTWTDAAIEGEIPGYVASKQCEVGSALLPSSKGRLIAYGTTAFAQTLYTAENPYTADIYLASK